MATDLSWMKERHKQLLESALAWEPPILESANEPRCTINGVEMIMLSANNYLNSTTHPKVVRPLSKQPGNMGLDLGR